MWPSSLFPDSFDHDVHRFLAISEAIAHLDYAESEGKVGCRNRAAEWSITVPIKLAARLFRSQTRETSAAILSDRVGDLCNVVEARQVGAPAA